MDRHPVQGHLERVKRNLTLEIGLSDLIGESPAFRSIIEEIKFLSRSDGTVLITGETGTGKDLCARAIHYTGARRGGPFIAVNCGGIPDELFENEFFGHERGAYTDASERATGLLRQAEHGTIFLDDVESLSPKNQSKLLRFLQSGAYNPLGAASEAAADVRVVASSNQDLAERMRVHTFREDLYFRLAVLTLHIPPLRERSVDIPSLARAFGDRFAARYGIPSPAFSTEVLEQLLVYRWPGNIRELENVIHRAIVHSAGGTISEVDLPRDTVPPMFNGTPAPATFKALKREMVTEFERDFVVHLLDDCSGNISEAARRAGKDRRAFWELMRKHHIASRPH